MRTLNHDMISGEVIQAILRVRGKTLFARATLKKGQSIEKLNLGKNQFALIASDLDALVKKRNPDAGIHIIDVESCKTIDDMINRVVEAIAPESD